MISGIATGAAFSGGLATALSVAGAGERAHANLGTARRPPGVKPLDRIRAVNAWPRMRIVG